jgi:hypothetical protein
MLAGETKYNQITQENTWEAKSKEEQQILTLTAQLKATTDKLNELSKGKCSNKPAPKQDANTKRGSNNKLTQDKDKIKQLKAMYQANQGKVSQVALLSAMAIKDAFQL